MKKCILSITFAILLILTGAAYASDALSPRVTLIDTPNSLTSATEYSIRVGGIGVVSFKYSIDNGSWSDEYDVKTKIVFSIMSEGLHILSVIGRNTAGFWQAENEATLFSWVIDRTPPQATLSNFPTGTISATNVEIRVGGTSFYRYRLDGYLWSKIYSVSIPVILSDFIVKISCNK